MTDTTTPEAPVAPEPPEQGWGEDSAVSYPEWPKNPANHRFTISMNGQGPMVVVRGNTAEEVNAAWQELEAQATGAVMGNAWAAIKAAAMVANGLGATAVSAGAPAAPQGPPAPPVMGTGPAFNPPPAMPGVTGQAPAAWQNAGAPPAPAQGQWGGQAQQGPSPEYAQAGWYRLTVPFPQKGAFDAITAQHQMRKGRPSEGGSFSFQKADKSWYVSPQYAGAFPQFSPVPA